MINTTHLRALRVDRGYSIRSLAKAAGVDHQTIRRLENGADPGDLPLRVLDRIATALGVTSAALLASQQDAHHELQQRLGSVILSAPGISTTTAAASLATSVETVEAALPALATALTKIGLTIARHGDNLHINPSTLMSASEADTRPMTLNEARLLRRIHRGEDVRRSMSRADRELTLPRLIRTGLVDPTPAIPTTEPDMCSDPVRPTSCPV